MNCFTKWYVNILATATGICIAGYLGALHLIWQSDVTKISVLIAIVWAIGSLRIGWIIKEDNIFDTMEMPRFMSELCAGLGMIGTIVGFIVMVQGVELHNAEDSSTLKVAIIGMLQGFGVAMYTTLVGTIAALSLNSQMVGEE